MGVVAEAEGEEKTEKKPRRRKLKISFEEAVGKLKVLVETVTGKRDVKSRVAVLADPDNPQSMSILTRGEARFVSIAKLMAGHETWGEMWKPLEDYADQLLKTNLSIGGQRSEQVIRFMGALSESGILKKLGLTVKGGEMKEGEGG